MQRDIRCKVLATLRVFPRPFTYGGDKALMGGGHMRGDIDLMGGGDLTLIDYIIN